jgi:hypothetical protein
MLHSMRDALMIQLFIVAKEVSALENQIDPNKNTLGEFENNRGRSK